MRKNMPGRLAVNLFLFLLVVALSACGSKSSNLPPSSSGTGTDTGTGTTVVVGTVSVTAYPTAVIVGGLSSIEAAVLDDSSNNVPDGTVVTFSLDPSSLGAIPSQATTVDGVAKATFTANSTTSGTVTITATAGGVSDTVTVTIQGADAGSIEFSSASPQVIGLKGSGQTETSTITFLVKDVNGNTVTDGTSVRFAMKGPGGGETLDPLSTSTVNGEAVTILHSGTVAGPVTIVASVDVNDTTSLATSSFPISIGGGVPTSRSFTLATDVFNLPGLAYVNRQANISAFIADRFGNYNILEGTSISFYAEAGAIDRSVNVDSTGAGSVIFRTQNPMPADVEATPAETTLQGTVLTTWNISTSNNPRDGWVTVLATVMGEESFVDANANGIYDLGEDFDDLGEPFMDLNDNGVRDDETSGDPLEEYIDANNNGQYDGPNGCWDGPNPASSSCSGREDSKMLYMTITLMFTGQPVNFAVTPSSFTILDAGVPNEGSQDFTVIIADTNLNTPSPGTTISVSADGGKLSAYPPTPVADGLSSFPIMFSFTLSDSKADDTDPPENVRVVVEVEWEGVKYPIVISGTID
ncbi:hypothetical protein BMS3Bbin07_00849 [bacterium BMS3Bbin07]|nr:hypothetical protein BMS3Bbin07_00849 [bacterium BMS3Bbin07]